VNPLLRSYRLSLHSLRSRVRAGHSMANPPRWVTVLAAVSGDGFILASSFSIGSNWDLLQRVPIGFPAHRLLLTLT
jgi:hypothetical protein